MEIGENGWPTFPGRSYEDQASILRVMVQAVHDFRGTYNVRDYRWFNLRDSQTGHPGVFQNSGLLEDDYDEKPAFAAYRELVARHTALEGRAPASPRSPRLSLRLRYRAGRTRAGRRCARSRVRASVRGADRGQALRAGFRRDGRLVARDTRPPLGRVMDRGPRRIRAGRHRAAARVRLADGRLVRLARRYWLCARRAQ
jgi:hypothetical protein